MLTTSDGFKSALINSFASMGANTFTITNEVDIGNFKKKKFMLKQNNNITFNQAQRFKNRMSNVGDVSISFSATDDAVVQYQATKTSPKISVIGTDENYLTIQGLKLSEGRNFTSTDIVSGKKMALIGNSLRTDLFGSQPCLGHNITIGSQRYMIVGTLAAKGSAFGSSEDNNVLVPIIAAQNGFPVEKQSYQIAMQVKNIKTLDKTVDEATGLFRIIRGLRLGDEDDFSVLKSVELANILSGNVFQLTVVAFVIGLITLIGAAVGLTNIMFVSVTERTKEIGIRKALGATHINIRNQFLWEAIVICQLGGFLGIFAGIMLGNLVSSYFSSEFLIPWVWIITGFLLCFVTGLIAGLYPAIKASKLDPVEALRYE